MNYPRVRVLKGPEFGVAEAAPQYIGRARTEMTEDEFRDELRRVIAREFDGNQSEAARTWKVKTQYINAVLNGKRAGPQIAAALGYRIERVYARA